LPGRANATIRSPAAPGSPSWSRFGTVRMLPQSVDSPAIFVCDQSETAIAATKRVKAKPTFRSLRLSVRTPPFHGGESGSIPLGSAINFNGLAPKAFDLSNICPINTTGRR
jgi:hypothetical protein